MVEDSLAKLDQVFSIGVKATSTVIVLELAFPSFIGEEVGDLRVVDTEIKRPPRIFGRDEAHTVVLGFLSGRRAAHAEWIEDGVLDVGSEGRICHLLHNKAEDGKAGVRVHGCGERGPSWSMLAVLGQKVYSYY